MRLRSVILVASLLLISAMAFAGGQGEAGTIKIGVAGAHSGDLASYGLPTVNAAQLVADQINEAGGINGRRIELIVEDDQCEAGPAANTAAKLISDDVVAVIGHICSGATNAALPAYLAEEVVVISPSATAVDLEAFPNFFVTIATNFQQAETQVGYMLESFDLERVAVLHDKDDYGKGLAEDARTLLEEAGVTVAVFEGITSGAVDYSAVLNRVDAANVDAVIYGGYHPEASKLVDQMRSKGMEQIFFSGDGVKDATFIEVAGEAAEGVYATGPRDTSSNPLFVEAAERHMEEYDEEYGAFFMNAYAAALVLFDAIEQGGSTEYSAIIENLTSNFVDTPLGRVSFEESGLPIGVGYSVYQVEDGVFVERQE
ncbi:MAG: branched-chain amino acid ABC transporter substrate-binding protein [Spirochaetota bacterium]